MDFKSSLVIDMKGDDSVIVGRRATTKAWTERSR